MALFSSNRVVTVATSVVRLIKDAALPDSPRTGMLTGLFSGGDISAYAIEELVGSVGVRAERMFAYGQAHYTHGLPSGQFISAMEGKAEVQTILAGIEGQPVLVEYSHFAPPNMLHIAWLTLIQSHGYNQETNILSSLSASMGKTVYLQDLQVVVPSVAVYEVGALDQWGSPATAGYTPNRTALGVVAQLRAATPVLENPLAPQAQVRATYMWIGPREIVGYNDGLPVWDEAPVKTGTFNITFEAYADNTDYYHVKYRVGTVTKYWLYQAGTGTYPELDSVFDRPAQTNGTFFPFAYFRYAKVADNVGVTSQAYLTSKRLLKYVGIDYDTLADAINDESVEGNADIANVEQAMLVLAVPANTSNPVEQHYLYDFFDKLFDSDANQFASPVYTSTTSLFEAAPDISKSALVIQDSRFKMSLSNSGVYKSRKVGNFGPKGGYSSAVEEIFVAQEYAVIYGESGVQILTHQVPIKVHVYRQQITATLYDELRVVNLKMLYHIFEDYKVTADELDEILLIPLDHSITTEYTILEREILYARSLHLVFNSVLIRHLKWYETETFNFFMILGTVYLTFSGLGDFGAALMKQVAVGATRQAIVMMIAMKIGVSIAISYVMKLFVKAIGAELAFLVAILAAAAGVYDAVKTGSITGAPWASELLQISSSLTKAVSSNVQDMMKDLLGEYQSFNLFKDETTKQLEAANKLLEHDNRLNPFVIFGESPNDFYNRTVHSGNVGIAGISAISSYVDIALTLPKMNETIGEATYG